VIEKIKRYWATARSPAKHFSLAFLTLGGFAMGIIFWGGFNTAMEFTNTETFCTGCHEMRENVYEELQYTIHFSNRSGVRAKCSDCHVPHEWTDKIARKMQASKEVWGKIFGTINTREKFLDKRLHLAQNEWARLKSNDSLECRNCHDFDYMDFTKQSNRASLQHSTSLASGDRHVLIATRVLPTNSRICRVCPVGTTSQHRHIDPPTRHFSIVPGQTRILVIMLPDDVDWTRVITIQIARG